jgi:general secretion pathway protein F
MADFAYKAADANGRIVEGQIEARGRDEAFRSLVDQGLTPVGVFDRTTAAQRPETVGAARRSRPRWVLGGDRPTRADVLAMTSELAVMLRAGLPLDGALRVLLTMDHRPSVTALIAQILESVKGGMPLSRALASRGELFGAFYVNMVRSGEASGQLGAVLTRLVEHLERMRALRESVTSALIYPGILLTVALFSVVGILVFIVPQFETLFRDAKEALPLSTRIVLAAGHLLIGYGVYLLIAAVVLGYLLARWIRSAAGQRWWHAQLAQLPVLGRIRHDYDLARFSRTFGTLLANGVPILAALGIAGETVDDEHLRDSIKGVTPRVKSGGRLAEALQKTGSFEPLAVNLVRVGEETGSLDRMVLELAAILDRKVETGIKRGLTLLEPVMILVLGLIIGLVIVSILMGILTVNELAL